MKSAHFFDRQMTGRTPPVFVAEISCNHCGNISKAKALIKLAKQSGANAVKIQVYTPDELTLNSSKDEFMVKSGLWKGTNLFELYNRTQTPPGWVSELFRFARSINMPIFSSVFGTTSLAELEKNNCQAYKIASFEFNDRELIRKVCATGKPIILSTGTSTIAEIKEIYTFLKDYKHKYFMHCVSEYPCRLDRSSLFTIKKMQNIIGKTRVGYSDHTKGHLASALAVCLGAKIIEKHFYSPEYGGTEDKEFSATPEEFKGLVIESMKLLNACRETDSKKQNSLLQLKRSLYIPHDLKEGHILTEKDVVCIRPSGGLKPDQFLVVLGKKINKDIEAASPLKKEDIKW